ncbi:L domain-like protein [Cryptosporidium felis]|nr:L domain-like protein [Cryptosporidium felis]
MDDKYDCITRYWIVSELCCWKIKGTVVSIISHVGTKDIFEIELDSDISINSHTTTKNSMDELRSNKEIIFTKKDEISTGISFQEAVRNRYLSEEDADLFVGSKKSCEYLKNIVSLSLENMNISSCMCKRLVDNSIESPSENSFLYYPNITSLCLNDNLFSDWKTLYCIISHLPKLEYLTINGNQLKKMVELSTFQFKSIKVISLSRTYIDFGQIISICGKDSVFPNVEYINASSNNYRLVSNNLRNRTVKKLDLSVNRINDWNLVENNILSNMSNLTSLNISENPLINLPKLKIGSNINYKYENILELNLDNCGIKELETIVYFRESFPNLQHISLRNNEFLNGEKIDMRSIIISLIKKIKTYNRSIIDHKEIVSCQRYYIYQYTVCKNKQLREIDPNGEILCEFVIENEIIRDENSDSNPKSENKEGKYIDINFTPQSKLLVESAPTKIKINNKMPISDIKVLIWRLFKIPKNDSFEYVFVNNKTKVKIDGYSDSYSLVDLGIETSGNIYIQDKE